MPQVWKHAFVTPVFKNGTTCEANNYRPTITITIPNYNYSYNYSSKFKWKMDIANTVK